MINDHPRISRELRTVEAMIGVFCRDQHGTGDGLCSGCEALRAYAQQRLEHCPFQEGKTTCAKCPVHCYKPEMRVRIRAVMRYAGPRMLYRHPIMTLQHLTDGRRSEPLRDSRP
ncbi:nitrous oxide-stimulated promoter family protein [Chloroflexota bacterium]